MKNISLLSLLIFVAACDAPSGQRRQIFQTPIANGLNQPVGQTGGFSTGGSNGNNTGNTTAGTSSGGTTSTDPASSATAGSGFESCNLTAKGATTTLGSMGFCQSTLDESQFKFQTTSTDTTSRTCLIPTYRTSTEASTNIGQPQCTFTQSGKIYVGKLYKDSAYSSLPINGVIIMKEALLPGYYDCMRSYTFYQQNRNCTYEVNYQACMRQYGAYVPNAHNTCCAQQAATYQSLVCNTFKANFSGQYLDIRIK